MSRLTAYVGLLCIAISTSPLSEGAETEPMAANSVYFSIDVGHLIENFDKSHIVSDPEVLEASFYQMETTPRVVVPPGVEAYLLEPQDRNNEYAGYQIIGRKPPGVAVDGQLYVLRRHPEQAQKSTLAKFDFHADATPATTCEASDFHRAKGRYFQLFWSPDYAGSAMFRHLAIESLREVGESASPIGPNWPLRRSGGVDETIRLVSGGRAVSENLQFDRELAIMEGDDHELKKLSDVEGIRVREIDWTGRLSKEPTQLDPLARLVPHDQYAVFVPSFAKLVEIVDRSREFARPIAQWFEPQSRTTDVLGFYQSQLGLSLDIVTRQIGGTLVDEVTITGSDPYFRTGTDIAVLMQTNQPAILYQAILAQISGHSSLHEHVAQIEHQFNDHKIVEWSNPRRDFSSLVTVVDDAVVVSNSIAQMNAILGTVDSQTQSMAELDEYRFFRERYRREGTNESALIVITDAAIRRWCGPQWRISAARRTRARASIAELTMQHADALIAGDVKDETQLQIASSLPDAGTLMLTSGGVRSDRYGTLDFQTPIAELNVTTATAGEVELYVGWRDRYQRRWRNVFDPIALQLSIDGNSFSGDLSVIPLILGTEYRSWQTLIGDVTLKSNAGDRHDEELLTWLMALDVNSPQLRFASMFLGNGEANINMISWIDDSIHLYLDSDETWMRQLAAQPVWESSSEKILKDLPIGLFVPSKDSLKQALFVGAVRTFLSRSSPNLIRWESIKHKDIEFIQATAAQSTPIGDPQDMPQLYYVTLPDGLTISLNERVICRAIDRHLARKEDTAELKQLADEDAMAESGAQLETRITGVGAQLVNAFGYQAGLNRMHRLSWGNLPILNYLRHRYPDRDPKTVYRQLFGQTLVEPGGGEYVWDDEISSYVSTLQGYHLEPKAGPVLGLNIKPDDVIETSLSFQDDGLRAKLRITSASSN